MAWSIGAGLEGKGVIVTGAAGGIGRQVAEAFATTGARVMAVDLVKDAGEAGGAQVGREGPIAVGPCLRKLEGEKPPVTPPPTDLCSTHRSDPLWPTSAPA